MKHKKKPEILLIAPCGMNCAVCSRYLSYLNNLKRSQCSGCRPGNKKCSYLFERCSGINSDLKSNAGAQFCTECKLYPCSQINRMDKRYKNSYGMSVKENLERIREIGLELFTEEQDEKYRCLRCDGLISVHNRKCFKCDTITRLVEKLSRKSD